MKFSQRIGKTQATKKLQINFLDDELKNRLWNGIKIFIIDNLNRNGNYSSETEFYTFAQILWHCHYKLAIDTIPQYDFAIENFIRDSFFNKEWYQSYDLLEFLANIEPSSFDLEYDEFIIFCNNILEQEFSGYRFINNKIAPITNEHEIQEIEEAISQSENYTSLRGVNIHLKNALDKLSDKKNPDYRNSIKESISAIESVTKVISGNEKDSLGGAIDKIKGKIKIHSALEKGFKMLYGYTSDSDGIRHSLMDNPTCDFEDAKYMLVSSSAFINYLIAKASKLGVFQNS